jgi:hypothetical protein
LGSRRNGVGKEKNGAKRVVVGIWRIEGWEGQNFVDRKGDAKVLVKGGGATGTFRVRY